MKLTSEPALWKFRNGRRGLSDWNVSRRAHGRSKAGRPKDFGGLVIGPDEPAARRAVDGAQRIEGIAAGSGQFAEAGCCDRIQLLAGCVQAQMDGVQTGRQRIGRAREIQQLSEFVGVLPVSARFRNWVCRRRVQKIIQAGRPR